MPASVAQLVQIRSTLAESIGQYYTAVIANLDRTPWSHHGSGEKIPASQVAVLARVNRRVTEPERRERKEHEDDERRRRMDPEVAAFYEEPRQEHDREKVAWTRECRNLTRAVLKGAPGGGKTFLAQTTALDLAREGQQQLESQATILDRLPLPIMVELKKLGRDKLPRDLASALIEVLAEHYPVCGRLEAWVSRKLAAPECWLILDGLDEVDAKHRESVKERLAAIEAADWKCRVLVTCRTANFADGHVPWRKLVTYELAPLEPTTIGKLIGRWYGEEDVRGQRLREVIASSYSLQQVCRSPLLAALACVAHEERSLTGDATRRDLYQRVVDSVLRRRWKGADEEAAGNLNVDDLKSLLRPMAWRLFASSPAVNQFSNEQVTDAITKANQGRRMPLSTAPIRDKLVRSGLLVQAGKNADGDEQLSFMHRTMLEYLAGEHLGRSVKQEGWERARVEWGQCQRLPVSLLVEKKAWLPEWREVLVLLGGSLVEAALVDRFIELLMGVDDDLFAHRLGLVAVSLAEQPMGVRKKLRIRVDEITRGGYELYWGHLRNGTVGVLEHFLSAWKSVGKLNGRVADGRGLLVDLVQAVLGDAEPGVHRDAAKALGSLGEAAARPDVLEPLVRAVLGDDIVLRWSARSALAKMMEAGPRPEVLAALAHALGDARTSTRENAAETLGRLGEARPEVLAALARTLTGDTEASVRSETACALGMLGTAWPEVLATLVQTLKGDAAPEVRDRSLRALGHLAEAAARPEVLAALVHALKTDAVPYVRSAAAEVLGKLGAAEPEIVEAITHALCSGVVDVRRAAEALGKLEAAGPEVVEALVRAVCDGDRFASEEAAKALGRMSESTARPEVPTALVRKLGDADQWHAASALSAMMSGGWRIFGDRELGYRAEKTADLAQLPPPYESEPADGI